MNGKEKGTKGVYQNSGLKQSPFVPVLIPFVVGWFRLDVAR